jgi:hypothetical protein
MKNQMLAKENETDLGDHYSLNACSVWNVGTEAKIDHRPAPVYSSGRAIRYLVLDKVDFVLVILRTNECQTFFSETFANRTHMEHLK